LYTRRCRGYCGSRKIGAAVPGLLDHDKQIGEVHRGHGISDDVGAFLVGEPRVHNGLAGGGKPVHAPAWSWK